MPEEEREYFRCAATWLACRLEVMTGRTWLHPERPSDLSFALLGEHDYLREMEFLVKELARNRKER